MKRATDRLERAEAVLVAMARCIEGKDPNTQGHCERLSDYATRLAQRLGLTDAEVDALRLGGIVHDIGKVAIPDAILFKPTSLDEVEWGVMRKHPVEGERICAGLTSFQFVLPVIRHHHEKLDGSGYPDGLAGDAIPLTARVLQVVDIYDALTTTRPYKPALSPEGAFAIMEREVERGWRDPRIFSEFRQLIREDLCAADGAMALAN
jgi:putative two-component system response regulator